MSKPTLYRNKGLSDGISEHEIIGVNGHGKVRVLVPVEPDRKTIQIVADALEIYEGQDFSEPAARWSAAVDVLAALGIGDDK